MKKAIALKWIYELYTISVIYLYTKYHPLPLSLIISLIIPIGIMSAIQISTAIRIKKQKYLRKYMKHAIWYICSLVFCNRNQKIAQALSLFLQKRLKHLNQLSDLELNKFLADHYDIHNFKKFKYMLETMDQQKLPIQFIKDELKTYQSTQLINMINHITTQKSQDTIVNKHTPLTEHFILVYSVDWQTMIKHYFEIF